MVAGQDLQQLPDKSRRKLTFLIIYIFWKKLAVNSNEMENE